MHSKADTNCQDHQGPAVCCVKTSITLVVVQHIIHRSASVARLHHPGQRGWPSGAAVRALW